MMRIRKHLWLALEGLGIAQYKNIHCAGKSYDCRLIFRISFVRDCVILKEREWTRNWYFEKLSGLRMRHQLLRQYLRNKERKGCLVCSTISRALQAVMSPGYVPQYTERSLSQRCISRDAARPGHLTYKMVSVFQLYRNKLWIIGMNAKQLVDYSTFFSLWRS